MNRKPKILAIFIGLVFITSLVIASLWILEFLPTGLREWLYLRAADITFPSRREPKEFDFFVVGHLYGSPSIPDQLPAKLLLMRLPEILSARPEFMVSLGDMVYQKSQKDFSNLETSLLKKLTFPLYNSPGNHDVANNRSLYESYFGNHSYWSQEYGPAQLIFLDTERVECSLDQPQLDMLQAALTKALNNSETRFIFVFMHKTLVFQDSVMKALKNKLAMPNVWDCQNKNGANPLIENIFKPAARQKPVIIFAGDVGAWGNLSPYYQRDPWLPLTLVMTGLGDTPQDNIIRVHVSPTLLSMDVLFLEDMHNSLLQSYDHTYWINVARGSNP